MLFINQKYKPVITKPVIEPDYNTSIMPSVQGKGINELIQMSKILKLRKITKREMRITKFHLNKKI